MDFEKFLLGVRNVWDKLQALGATCGAGPHVRQEVWMDVMVGIDGREGCFLQGFFKKLPIVK